MSSIDGGSNTHFHMRSWKYPVTCTNRALLGEGDTVPHLPPATMADDADVVKRSAEAVLATGQEVVVVCHSYGGTPTTQALGALEDKKGVRRVANLSAIIPRVSSRKNLGTMVRGNDGMHANVAVLGLCSDKTYVHSHG